MLLGVTPRAISSPVHLRLTWLDCPKASGVQPRLCSTTNRDKASCKVEIEDTGRNPTAAVFHSNYDHHKRHQMIRYERGFRLLRDYTIGHDRQYLVTLGLLAPVLPSVSIPCSEVAFASIA